MAILGNLTVNLRANSSEFVQNMERARTRTAALGRSTQAVRGHMVGFGRSMLALAGIGGIGAMVRGTFNSADALQKLSIKLGESTENLSRLQHVADLSGVDFRSMSMGLQRMTRRISEAAVGGGEAKEAIKALGLDARALGKMPLAEQFLTVTKAMERVTNSGARVRLAMKFFDSEGVSMLQTMENGAQGIRDLMAESDALGKTRNTPEGEAGARAGDAMTRLGSKLRGTFDSAILEFADPIAGLLDNIREAMPAIGESVKQVGTWIGESVAKVMILLDRLSRVYELFRGVADRLAVTRTEGPAQKLGESIAARMPDTMMGRIGSFAAENLPMAFPALGLAGNAIGAGVDIAKTVTDPQNADIIKLLKAMLGALRNDPGTAVAG